MRFNFGDRYVSLIRTAALFLASSRRGDLVKASSTSRTSSFYRGGIGLEAEKRLLTRRGFD